MAEYDLLILGAGTSGLPTSRVAASKGKKVLLIGEKPIGGKCVNYGCTPTKFLVYTTKLYKEALKAKEFGIKTGSVELNFANAMDLTRNMVQESLNQNEHRLANINNIEFIPKVGKFVNDTDVQIEGETFSAKCNLIATGARNFVPPIKGVDEIEFLTPKSVWALD
ncbi:MAG: FAD-dependent oxidoreductase, partial [Promethearchaeota archaeon]